MKIQKLRKDDFYLPILRLLGQLGGSASIEEIEARLIEQFGFTPEDLDATYEKSGSLIVPDKISWARSYLKLAGLVHNEKRGVWVLTEEGRAAAAAGEKAIARKVAEALKAYHAKRRAEAQSEDVLSAAGEDREENGEGAADWSDRLLTRLQAIDPAAFERLCQRMLRESGFVRVEVTGKSGDGGIDGHGVLRMNLISFQVLFQCKRYQGSVGSGIVRDFRGAMQGRADKGLIITTGTFTADARKEATRDGAPAIDLIDGEALCLLLKDLQLGVKVRPVVKEEIEIDESFFEGI